MDEFEPSALIEDADEANMSDAAGATAVLVTLIGIWAVTLEPATLAVMVSVRSAKLTVPEDASAVYGIVTVPAGVEDPELTPSCPELAVKLTVAPETACLLTSTTVAVIVVEVEPSALTETDDAERTIEAADVPGEEVLTGVPPPLRQPARPKTSNAVAGNTCNLRMNMAIPIERALLCACLSPPAGRNMN